MKALKDFRWLVLSALALAVLLHQPALAQDGAEEAESVETDDTAPLLPLAESLTGEAKEALDEALLLLSDGDFQGASAKFQRAYELQADPRLLWNIAVCQKELRRYARASQLIERYLQEGGERLPEESRNSASETLEALRRFSSQVTLVGAPDGARVLIDAEEVTTTPLQGPLYLDLGDKQLRVELPGFVPFEQKLTIPGNTEIVVDVVLSAEEEPKEIPKKTTDVAPPEMRTFTQVLKEKWPALAAAGVGVAGGAVWTVFGVQSIRAKLASKAECDSSGCTQRGVDLRGDAIDAGNVATVGMIVTGVGLASATALWLTLPWKKAGRGEQAQHEQLGPGAFRLGAGVGTIQLNGRW